MKTLFRATIIALLLGNGIINAQVPQLSSYPSANAVIFLDFDGHYVYGTTWNTSGPIDCGGSGLTTDKITEIFNRVAEDYRPFNVNVTTDSTKFLSAPSNRRIRIILTVSSSWYGNAGGVAFLNSFTWNDDTPGFVFTGLLSYSVKNISEAASHEVGHSLGLYHQANYDANCTKISDYHSGTGSGEIGWAPIMGVGYYRNFTLWNNGPNSYGCTNYQNDLSIITTNNGFSYRTDDHSNLFNTATQVNFANNHFVVSGVVERNTDFDLMKFTMPSTGRFLLSAIPYNVGTGNAGSDLDMQVSLINSSQVTLNAYNPGTLLSSVIDTTLEAGYYYIKIEGKGNLYAPAYASLGSYSLEASFTASTGTLAVHKLELTGSLFGDNHKLNWNIVADEQITNLDIEISTDGRSFERLTQTATDARSFMYKPYVTTPAKYRLNVMFDDGRQYYSNVITLPQGAHKARPQLISNLIRGNTLTVSSPGKFNYMMYDMSGKIISRGQLSSGINTINADINHGMYMIRFADNDDQWTDKLIRQ